MSTSLPVLSLYSSVVRWNSGSYGTVHMTMVRHWNDHAIWWDALFSPATLTSCSLWWVPTFMKLIQPSQPCKQPPALASLHSAEECLFLPFAMTSISFIFLSLSKTNLFIFGYNQLSNWEFSSILSSVLTLLWCWHWLQVLELWSHLEGKNI